MIPVNIVIQSAGSLSVFLLSLIMAVLQLVFYFRKRQFRWFAWSAAISVSSMLYSFGIFLEYNFTGAVNKFGGLLEFTAIILLVQCLFGLTFSYLSVKTKYYHFVAGTLHVVILFFLWCTDYIVSDQFVSRHFIGLAEPFVELDIGPLGPLFEIYATVSCIVAVWFWFKYKAVDLNMRIPFLVSIIFWLLLGIHDGYASMGGKTLQYFMEYGFWGFSVVMVWIVFERFLDISAEDKYRTITEHAWDGILVLQQGKIVFTNAPCRAFFDGISVNSNLSELIQRIVPGDREKISPRYEHLDSLSLSEKPFVLHLTDGPEEKIIEVSENAMTYRNRPAILAVIRDITKRVQEEKLLKESEEKIVRLKKMESIGLLAGGVAHDLNNVLSGIVSYPDLIMENLPEGSALRKPIQTVKESGLRAAAIVQDLLTVARGVAIPKTIVSLNEVIRGYFLTPEYERLLAYHPDIRVKDELDPDSLNINGSSVHLGKVVMNLVSNACEAVNGSGDIIVKTNNAYLDRPLKGYNNIKIGEYVILTVEDNGPGIMPEDLQQIFEPFFTKKVMGRSGTGLGLTVVWNIVQDHEGYIDVTSGSTGTKFNLYFPITRESVAEELSEMAIESLHGEGERILVVDDVESQRDIICHMLEELNYRTKQVASGEAAIEYLKEHTADLLILDMIMEPGISGRDTYKKAIEINPQQKAIVVSGFAETDDVKKTLEMGAGRFLKKPIMLRELGLAVKEELNIIHENNCALLN